MKHSQKLVLLDAHAIIHRAYHALPQFSNSQGEPTGALYGVVAMLIKIIEELSPDYVVACYDLPGKTFRHEAYTDYKAGRKEADDALIAQLKSSRSIMEAFGIPIYESPGFEADDMLGTIVDQVSDSDIEVIIASGDMDTLQLVSGKKVQVYTLRKGIKDTVLYDEQAVHERFGFAPELLLDYKGLRGDPSDNIPGVKGVGEKTATTLIHAFGTLEDMYEILDTEEGKETFTAHDGISPRIVNLLIDEKETALFSKTLATIRRDAPIEFNIPEQTWSENLDLEKVGELCAHYELRTLWGRIQKIFGDNEEVESAQEELLPEEEIYALGIGLWLLNSDMTKPTAEDILQYAGTRSITEAKKYILKDLEKKKLLNVYTEIELPLIPIIQKMEDRGLLVDIDHFTKISKAYHKKLDAYEKKIYEMAGVEFNIKSPKQVGEVLFETLQLPTKGIKKTSSGGISTQESELEKLKDAHPIIEEILGYRHFQKMLSTYVDNLPDMVDTHNRLHTNLLQTGTTTGRFSSQKPNLQNIPADQEFGSAIRKGFIAPEGYKIVAIDYSQIELRVTAMLSQEPEFLRVFQAGEDIHAAVAAKVFNVAEKDVTSDMRRQAKVINFGIIYGMGITALQKNLGSTRKEAQEFYNAYFENFPGLRKYLDSIKDFAYAHGYTETLFGRRRYFPALQSKIPYVRAAAERMAVNAPIQGTATADIIKLALRDIDTYITEKGYENDIFPLLQVHDEIIFEIKDEIIDTVLPEMKAIMESVLENSFLQYESPVPIKVDAGIGDTWADAK